jgi:hypothetical protein
VTLTRAVVAVLALGAAHATLLACLAAGGHRPSFAAGLPVGADAYYRVASMYAVPLYFSLWAIAAAASHGAARALGGRGELRAGLAVLGPAYALPTLLLFVLPDLVIYLAAGHEALAEAMRWYAPLAPLAVVVLAGRALRRVYDLRRLHALVAAFVGFLAQALPAAWLLR